MTISLEISELTAAFLAHERDLERLNSLDTYPRVAILFLVCDDLVPLALSRLGWQTYPQVDVFILDDSKDPKVQRSLDGTRFRIVRRGDRTGYKAGNLNNWLWYHGSEYKYFVILDSDSIISDDFAESMVRYAEHPANTDVAIFNSLPMCWNTHLRFPRVLSTLLPLQNWIRMRLANRSPSIFSTGHNNLHRTEAILRVGAFKNKGSSLLIAL